MILATDVHYKEKTATAAGVLFEDWKSAEAVGEYITQIENIAEYKPGQFYKREMPCILALLQEHSLTPDIIIIDGYVFLDGTSTAGLGKHLYDALKGKFTIIGVAKNRFTNIDENHAVNRGKSNNPLFITAIGMDVDTAKNYVQTMHGAYRIPTMLKKADQLCRQEE